MNDSNKQHPWIGIWKPIMSFFVGVIVASFTFGSRIQKVNDLVVWKQDIAPKIERMDSVGSLSFDHWKKGYEKEQHHNEERLKTLETDVKELQKQIDP